MCNTIGKLDLVQVPLDCTSTCKHSLFIAVVYHAMSPPTVIVFADEGHHSYRHSEGLQVFLLYFNPASRTASITLRVLNKKDRSFSNIF